MQGNNSVAIGQDTGREDQKSYSVAIGYQAGQKSQGTQSVAIGSQAGDQSQGSYSIAIGNKAGYNSQKENTIILNASSSFLNSHPGYTGAFYVKPIRGATGPYILVYNGNGEITFVTKDELKTMLGILLP